MVVDSTPINVNSVLIEKFKATCTWDNTTASRKITRAKRYNEESWQLGGIRQTPGYLQKQPCHLSEDSCELPAMTYGEIHGH